MTQGLLYGATTVLLLSHMERLADPAPAAARPVRLDITGSELLLRGRFAQWVPVALERPGDEPGAVQLLVDVTSLTDGSGPRTTDALSFESHDVRSTGPLAHVVRGTLKAGRNRFETEVAVQTPGQHTPFCVLTFSLPKDGWTSLWRTLEARVREAGAPAPDGSRELRAQAWLRTPVLAAA